MWCNPLRTESTSEALERLLAGIDAPGVNRESLSNAIVKNQRSAEREVLERLVADSSILGFAPAECGSLRWVVQETHGHGRRPVIVSNNTKQFVYKPRCLAIEIAWRDFVCWFSERVGVAISYPYSIYTRDSYGWAEWVSWRSCNSSSEVNEYYWRLGALAALVWAVGGQDATASNIVACGAYPTLIDAELALSPADCIFDEDIAFEFRSGGISPTSTVDVHQKTIFIGAVSIEGVPCNHGNASNSCSRCYFVPRIDEKLVRLGGEQAKALLDGFRRSLETLRANRATLLGVSSPLQLFYNTSVRIAVRPSAVYAAVLAWIKRRISFAGMLPDVEALLHELPSRVPLCPDGIGKTLQLEIEALLVGDIPHFTQHSSDIAMFHDRTKLWTFGHSGMERAYRRLEQLSDERLDFACAKLEQLIAMSLRWAVTP